MDKPVMMTVLAAGILLVVCGVISSRSDVSSFWRLMDGVPTEGTMWLVAGGMVAIFAGVVGLTHAMGR